MTRPNTARGAVDPRLSAKRAEAGRKGAARRWGRAAADHRPKPHTNWYEGLKAWRESRPSDALRFRVQNAGGGSAPAEMWIYDEIVDGFTAEFWGFGISAKDVADELAGITADRITLHVNSPGGDVFEAHAIYNLLRQHDAEVDVRIDGLAASAASYISMAGDSVTMTGGAMIMIHDAIGFTYGNAADHTDMAARLDKISDGIAALYAERAGGSVEDWRDAMRAETWYDANEAVDAGLADQVDDDAGDEDTSDPKNATDMRPYSEAARHQLPTASNPGRTDLPSGPTGEGGGAPAAVATTDTSDSDLDVASIAKALEGAFA